MTTSEKVDPGARSLRVPDEVWYPFLELIRQVEHIGASAKIRMWMMSYLAEYKVFWAPELKDVDPYERPIPWYECVECNNVHRLSGAFAPWGCSVVKARDDRKELEAKAS